MTVKPKIFFFGEDHFSPLNHEPDNGKHSVYRALNELSDNDLKRFVEKNNIKNAFFEFIPHDDFPCMYDGKQYMLDLQESVNFKKNIKKRNALFDVKNPINMKNLQKKKWSDVVAEIGWGEAVEKIPEMCYNASILRNNGVPVSLGAIQDIANIPPRETYENQIKLIRRLRNFGVKTHGIESIESFAGNEDRLPSLNRDGAKNIVDIAKNDNSGALCVVGNAHLLGCSSFRSIKGYAGSSLLNHDIEVYSLTDKSTLREYAERNNLIRNFPESNICQDISNFNLNILGSGKLNIR